MVNQPIMVFTGTYHHAVDSKNRLFLPARLRKSAGRFIVTSGLDRCLYVYPLKSWVKLIEKLDSINLRDKSEERIFKRIFLSSAVEVQVDALGRIVIPQVLKKQACLKKDAVIIGVWSRLEIWSKDGWKSYNEKAKKVFSKLANKLDI